MIIPIARKRGRLDFLNEATEVARLYRYEKTAWKKELQDCQFVEMVLQLYLSPLPLCSWVFEDLKGFVTIRQATAIVDFVRISRHSLCVYIHGIVYNPYQALFRLIEMHAIELIRAAGYAEVVTCTVSGSGRDITGYDSSPIDEISARIDGEASA